MGPCAPQAAQTGTHRISFYAARTLVPGCSSALWLLQLIVMTPLDDFIDSMPPQVRDLEVYVDDASLQVTGVKGTVATIITKAANALFRAFQEGAGLPISETKGRGVASEGKTAALVGRGFKRHGYKAVRTMKILGVDTATGHGGVHGHVRIRTKAAEKRKARLENLRRLESKTANVTRSALPPTVTYGSRVFATDGATKVS